MKAEEPPIKWSTPGGELMKRAGLLLLRAFPGPALVARHVVYLRRVPDLRHPRTFNDKVLVKLLFDRDPRLKLFADKLAARDHVERKLGQAHLPTLYAVVRTADEIAQLDLPDRFVMKPNHLSGAVKIVADKHALDRNELQALATSWLARNYGRERGEWAYRDIPPRVFFEALLTSRPGPPTEYKFYCFGGEPRFVRVQRGRYSSRPSASFYDTEFRLIPAELIQARFPYPIGSCDPPPTFGRMLEIAALLSEGTDFLRVDLYGLNEEIVVGELTPYPSAGARRFEPAQWDVTFGSYWPSQHYAKALSRSHK